MKIIALFVIVGFVVLVGAILKFLFKNFWEYLVEQLKNTD